MARSQKLAPRGVALVEEWLATLESEDGSPLDAATIAELRLPDGRPLPPSLARVLAHDASPFVEDGALRLLSFSDLMRQEFDEETAALYQDFAVLLPGQCMLLEGGSDSRQFMYLGEPDSLGEYPVFVVDTDDIPYVCIAYPGLDLALADGNVITICDGTYEDCARDARYQEALFAQARTNFHGLLSVELGANVEAVPGVDPDEVLLALWGDG